MGSGMVVEGGGVRAGHCSVDSPLKAIHCAPKPIQCTLEADSVDVKRVALTTMLNETVHSLLLTRHINSNVSLPDKCIFDSRLDHVMFPILVVIVDQNK